MPTEREKMLAGEPYYALDPELVALRTRARQLCAQINASTPGDSAGRVPLVRELFGRAGADPWIEPPFYCDYGAHILLGDRVFMNFNCVILDCAEVHIGDGSKFGPAVQVYTAWHPVDPEARRGGAEFATPVRIGRDVWVGGGAIILPGVEIGDESVIGAGSIVTRNVPAGVVAVGNPCRVVRSVR